MTRNEAIEGLITLVEVRRKYFDMQTMRDEIEALEIAIKALEQEPILDKIRAEIDCDMREAAYMYDDEHLDELYSYQDGLEHALNIIDKYKVERSEE